MPKRCLHSAIAVVVAALALPRAAAAGEPRRIGIVVTVAVNLDSGEARALATELGDAIAAALPVTTVAGADVERRLPPGGLPEECVADAGCRNDLGRRLDADELLLLVAVKLGDRIQIDATWADVASGRVTSQPRITFGPEDDRAAVFAKAVPRLLPHIHPAEKAPPRRDPAVIVIDRSATEGGRHLTAPAWIALGVAGVAAVGGGLLGLEARKEYNELESDCPDCTQSDIDAGARHALYADILFGTAAAGAATAAVLYYLSDRGAEPPPATLSLGASPGSVAVTLGGRF